MKADAVLIVGSLMILIGVYVLWRAHRSPSSKIDLADLMIDRDLRPARVTLAKFAGLMALLVSTWILVYVTVAGKLDPMMLAAYLGAWGAVKVAGDYITAQRIGSNLRPDRPDDR